VSNSQLGAQYGGIMTTCQQQNPMYANYSACTKTACQTLFGNNAELLTGCNFLTGWLQTADNPNFLYHQVTCPSQLTTLAK
jgi:hypothetical protein